MSSSLQDSIVLITSADPDQNAFGTGFVIYHDALATYIATAGHVVSEIGGPEKLQVDKVQASVIGTGIADGVDLAVLRVEGLLDKPPLRLNSTAKKGQVVLISGFTTFNKQTLMLRNLSGVLRERVAIGTKQTKLTLAWDIQISEDNRLSPGISGSPVVNGEDGSVIAIIIYRQGEGNKGLAISVSGLVPYLDQPIRELVIPQVTEQATSASTIEQHVRIEVAMNALSDTPSKVDLLGFTAYAEALTDFIMNKNTEEPLSIVIDAPWGAGKTTLMQMIEAQLKDRAKKSKQQIPLIVEFNAWKYDQETSLWAAFVLKILQDVRKELPWQQRLGLWWRLNWNRMDWRQFFQGLATTTLVVVGFVFLGMLLNVWVSIRQGDTLLIAFQRLYATFAGGLSALVLLYTTAKAKYSSTTNPFSLKLARYIREPNYQEKVGFIAQFEDDFKVVMDAVTKHRTRQLIIFIDDLDRCAPPKPVEIVEAMNLLLDAEYCVFVLGMDSRTVAASIEAKYNNLLNLLNDTPASGGLTFGQRFLEKIVQITFRIPQTDESLVSSFIEAKLREQKPSQEVALTLRPPQAENGTPTKPAEIVSTGQLDPVNLVKQQQEQFAQQLNESPEVQDAIRQAAPYLESNPRKIKRFINLFRLQALIANRRGLLTSGAIRLDLLARWMVLVTRWPSIIDSTLVDKAFVSHLKEAYSLKEAMQKYQGDDDATPKEIKEQVQVQFNAILEDAQIKRLITMADLSILQKITDEEVEDLSTYLSLAQRVVAGAMAATVPPEEKSEKE